MMQARTTVCSFSEIFDLLVAMISFKMTSYEQNWMKSSTSVYFMVMPGVFPDLLFPVERNTYYFLCGEIPIISSGEK